jgi:sulfofructose kinase
MRDRSVRVFGLGQCSLDYLVEVERFPLPDAKCEFRGLQVQGGGPVATPGRATRTVFWRRPSGAPLAPGELDLERWAGVELLHTDGLMIDAALAASEAVRRAGGRVVVDGGTLREGMLDLARCSDAFVVSESFARELLGEDDPEAACHALAALGPGLVGVTLGARGWVARQGGKIWRGPAYPVEAKDTTGCGDVFHAGICYGMLEGWDAVRALDFAAWAASRVATRLGGRAGIPRREDYPAAASSAPPDQP